MFQIIKFCGITAEQVAALDRVLASDAVRSSREYWCYDSLAGDEDSVGPFSTQICFAFKKRVRSDSSHSYMYEIHLRLKYDSDLQERENLEPLYEHEHSDFGQSVTLHCPRSVIDAIYGAVHPLRDKEWTTPSDEDEVFADTAPDPVQDWENEHGNLH